MKEICLVVYKEELEIVGIEMNLFFNKILFDVMRVVEKGVNLGKGLRE